MSKNNEQAIIGIDLSLSSTGISVRNIDRYDFYNIKTSKKTNIYERYIEISNKIIEIVKMYISLEPIIYIEDYAFSRKSKSVHKLAELGGVVKTAIYSKLNVDFIAVPITSWKKKILGNGRLKKSEIKKRTELKFNMIFNNQDICDAFCIMKYGEAEQKLKGY